MTDALMDFELFWQVTAILRPLLPAAVLRVWLP
jgi:hypothetical protein